MTPKYMLHVTIIPTGKDFPPVKMHKFVSLPMSPVIGCEIIVDDLVLTISKIVMKHNRDYVDLYSGPLMEQKSGFLHEVDRLGRLGWMLPDSFAIALEKNPIQK